MGIFLCRQAHSARADVAQLVERSIRNRQVSGSIPLVGSIFRNRSPHFPSDNQGADLQSGHGLADIIRGVLGRQFLLDIANSKLVAFCGVTKGL